MSPVPYCMVSYVDGDLWFRNLLPRNLNSCDRTMCDLKYRKCPFCVLALQSSPSWADGKRQIGDLLACVGAHLRTSAIFRKGLRGEYTLNL